MPPGLAGWVGAALYCFAGLPSGVQANDVQAAQADELTCQANNYAAHQVQPQAPYWPRQVPAQRLDEACWVGADAIARTMADSRAGPVAGAGKPVLVDVRPRSAQKASPLAGAMQLELADLASKRFLRQEPLVLLGSGLDYNNLNQVCQQLRQQGFAKVQAVRGGVNAWQAAASGLGQQIYAIDASDWMASLGQGIRWTVLSIGSALQQVPDEQLPVPRQQIVAIQADGKERDSQQAMAMAAAMAHAYQDASKRLQGSPLAEALIVVSHTAMADRQRIQFEQALRDALASSASPRKPAQPSSIPLYWLQGGWQGYEQQVAQTAAIQQTASHRLQVPCGRL